MAMFLSQRGADKEPGSYFHWSMFPQMDLSEPINPCTKFLDNLNLLLLNTLMSL